MRKSNKGSSSSNSNSNSNSNNSFLTTKRLAGIACLLMVAYTVFYSQQNMVYTVSMRARTASSSISSSSYAEYVSLSLAGPAKETTIAVGKIDTVNNNNNNNNSNNKEKATVKPSSSTKTDYTNLLESSGIDIPKYTMEQAQAAIVPELGYCDASTSTAEAATTTPRRRRATKFAFVHIFKTAGSTLRSFFYQYSKQCGLGWIVLIGCSGASAQSISSGKHWKPCDRILQYHPGDSSSTGTGKDGGKGGRGGGTLEEKPIDNTVNNTRIESQVDIFGGHFMLGSGDWLKQKQTQPTTTTTTTSVVSSLEQQQQQQPIRHITFFRDAAAKLVSGFLFIHPEMNFEETVAGIKKRVMDGRQGGKYMQNYRQYLLTPYQKQYNQLRYARNPNDAWTPQQEVHQMMQNLVDYNVLVGITEQMSDSMRLLQHVLDHEEKLTDLFVRYGMELPSKTTTTPPPTTTTITTKGTTSSSTTSETAAETTAAAITRVKSNVSHLSTSRVMKELQKDADFWENMLEYTKFDQMVTEFAKQMHVKQVECMKKKNKSSSSLSSSSSS